MIHKKIIIKNNNYESLIIKYKKNNNYNISNYLNILNM